MIRKGDRVTFKPEWSDPGDETILFVAIDDEEKGRVTVQAMLGMFINPTQVVRVDMIETRR